MAGSTTSALHSHVLLPLLWLRRLLVAAGPCCCLPPLATPWCCRFNYSVFHHQIMLKGFNYVGGMPEHLIKRAHLDVSSHYSWQHRLQVLADVLGPTVDKCCCLAKAQQASLTHCTRPQVRTCFAALRLSCCRLRT